MALPFPPAREHFKHAFGGNNQLQKKFSTSPHADIVIAEKSQEAANCV